MFAERDIEVLPWRARSQDLNPIENIWSWIDTRLLKSQLTSVKDIKTARKALWLENPKEMCMRLIESMPKRVRACFKAKGVNFLAYKESVS